MKIRADKSQKILLVDFDGTLSAFIGPPPELPGPPIEGALKYLPKFHQAGWKIHIFSRRANHTGGLKQIADWMDKFNLPYEAILTTKPEYSLIIDDNSISPKEHSWESIYNEAMSGKV